jgi:hypothetical protein
LRRLGAAISHPHELNAAASELGHHTVGQRGCVDGGDVSVYGLVSSRQDLDLEPGPLASSVQEFVAV